MARTITPLGKASSLFRSRVTAARKAGIIPADLAVSVRSEYYSMGSSIRVTMEGAEDWALRPATERERDYYGSLGDPFNTATEAALATAELLHAMLTAAVLESGGLTSTWREVKYGYTTLELEGGDPYRNWLVANNID